MSTSGRSTRGSTATADEFFSMTARDRLIFSQAVYEFGAGAAAWPQVSKILSRHPLLIHLKHMFTTQNCPNIYDSLLTQASLQRSGNYESKKASTSLKLAEHFYVTRIQELKRNIASEEVKFRTLITEMDEIRSGQWDTKIRADLGIEPEEGEDVSVIDVDAGETHAEAEREEVEGAKELEDGTLANHPLDATSHTQPLGEIISTLGRDRTPADHVSVIVEEASENQDDDSDSGEAPMDMSSPLVVATERRAPSPVKLDELEGAELRENVNAVKEELDELEDAKRVEDAHAEAVVEAEKEADETEQDTEDDLAEVEADEEADAETSENAQKTSQDDPVPQTVSDETSQLDNGEIITEPDLDSDREREHGSEPEPTPEVEVDNDSRTATRSSARLRSKALSPQRQTSIAKDNKPLSKSSQASRVSRRSTRETVIEEENEAENVDTEPDVTEPEVQSRTESTQPYESEREETPIQVKMETEDAADEQVEDLSRDSTPPKRETGKRRAEGSAQGTARGRKRVREESEPTAEAASPATSIVVADQKNLKERKRFQNVIGMLHTQIAAHRSGTIFHNPIKPADAPDYSDIVKRPMDLKTIKGRVRDGQITTSSEYTRDIFLMFANSLMYNRPKTDIYDMAEEMMLESEAHINTFRQTEGFAQAWTRS